MTAHVSALQVGPTQTGDKPVAIVAGFGPGLGAAVARRFATGGYLVIGLARSHASAGSSATEVMTLDLADPDSVKRAIADVNARFGAPTVLIHTAAALVTGPFLELSADDFERAWRACVLSAVNVCAQAIPLMLACGGGSIILSGTTASMRGGSGFAPFASAKFALRGLAGSLAREFHPRGVHVAHVVLDGVMWTERSRERFLELQRERSLDPEDVAEAYWGLAHQPSSAWTHEIDLRPSSETF